MLSELLKQRKEDQVHLFLIGLDDAIFGTIRSSILQMEPIPSIKKTYAMIVREEALRNLVKNREIRSEAVAFAAARSYHNSMSSLF